MKAFERRHNSTNTKFKFQNQFTQVNSFPVVLNVKLQLQACANADVDVDDVLAQAVCLYASFSGK